MREWLAIILVSTVCMADDIKDLVCFDCLLTGDLKVGLVSMNFPDLQHNESLKSAATAEILLHTENVQSWADYNEVVVSGLSGAKSILINGEYIKKDGKLILDGDITAKMRQADNKVWSVEQAKKYITDKKNKFRSNGASSRKLRKGRKRRPVKD